MKSQKRLNMIDQFKEFIQKKLGPCFDSFLIYLNKKYKYSVD